MAEALVSIALEVVGQQLTEVAGEQLSLFAGATHELEELSSRFESIKAVLDDAESRQVGEKRVQLWLSRLRHVAYDFEDLVMDASNHATSRYNVPRRIKDRYDVAQCIKEIKERLDQIDADRNSYGFISYSQGGGDHRTLVRSDRLTTGLIDKSEMFMGRENDKETMISKLVSGNSHEDPGQVQVVAVVGMGGLGKTTLARQIYHDGRVRDHFYTALYWVCVSDVFDEKRLTKAILEQVKGSTSFLELDALQKELMEALRGKHFLLVLDDVWNDDAEKWNKLQLPLNSGAQGCRILITTRSQKVANTMNATFVHELTGLSDDDSWELFRSRAFAGKKVEEFQVLKNVGRKIVSKCKGVPLSIKVIGSAMNTKRTVEDWKNVLESKIWSLRQATDKILPALLLTYCHLPAHLKQCFTYCSIFPKDWKLEKDRLVRLWVAQGFIQSEGSREKEDIGEEYFNDLVAWSLFQEINEDYYGKITCKMHDLLAEFIAKDEIYCREGGKSEECPSSSSSNVRHAFLSFANRDDKPSKIPIAAGRAKKLRTLWLDGTVDGGITSVIDGLFHEARFLRALYFPSSTSLPKSIGKLKHLRCLDLPDSQIKELPDAIRKMKQLRVLHMPNSRIVELPNAIRNLNQLRILHLPYSNIVKLPNAIGDLKHLRYLNLSHNRNIVELPESVSDLCNLHTLNLSHCHYLKKLPWGIGGMVNLRHLEIERTDGLKYLPKGSGRIIGLRSLSKFIVRGGNEGEGCEIDELQPLNSLQGSLAILNLKKVSSKEEAEEADLWKKQHLCSLVLEMSEEIDGDAWTGTIDSVLEGLRPHDNLKELKLAKCTGSKLPSWIDGMRHLRKLVLYYGFILERVPHLPSLKELEILGLRIEELPGEGWEQLMALQKLRIDFCRELKCLPEGLTQLPSLEYLYVTYSYMVLLPEGLGQLKKLKELHVGGLEVLRCLPHSIGQLESLKILWIWSCKKLESVPDSLGQLKALVDLNIRDCEAIASLPQGLRHLSLLQALWIDRCPLLTERCRREGGVDWPNISHIPKIHVNGKWIQLR